MALLALAKSGVDWVNRLQCRKCGAKLEVIASITDGLAIRRILEHVGLSPPENEKPPPIPDFVRVPVDAGRRGTGSPLT